MTPEELDRRARRGACELVTGGLVLVAEGDAEPLMAASAAIDRDVPAAQLVDFYGLLVRHQGEAIGRLFSVSAGAAGVNPRHLWEGVFRDMAGA